MNEKITVLYVDDEPLNLMLFEHNFRKLYDVYTAESGEEGIEKLKQNTAFNVVISDMKMPEMDGVDFIKKAREKYPNISYFILSGYDINEKISEAIEQKLILGYFKKPFNKTEIVDSIAEVIK